jgi:predicted dehydrogenase
MAIRIVVAGLGGRGQDWVREVRASAGFELAGCVEVEPAVLQGSAAKLNIPSDLCFANLDQALNQVACDAVIVATSVGQHVAACEEALSRRLALLVEKPFTQDLREAATLVSTAEGTGTPLLVAQNYRYMRSFRTAHRLVREGRLGKVGMVVMQYYRVPHEMAASLAKLPNSVLWGASVHHLDAIRFVLGQEASSVAADMFTSPWNSLPPGASLHALLTMDDGARVSYTATYESSGHEFFERGQEFYARFVGERATLHVFQRWLFLCEKGKLPRPVRRGARTTTEEQNLLGQLERAILRGEAAEVSGRDNLRTVALLEACVRSAAEKRSIDPRELLNGSK